MHRVLLLLVGLALLAGCQTEVREGSYQAPPAGSGVASLRGCSRPGAGFMDGRHDVTVVMIDDKLLPKDLSPEETVNVAAGMHTVVLGYRNSPFRSQATLSFEAAAGGIYRAGLRTGREGKQERRFCELWIEDATTGRPVTPVVHRLVTGGDTPSLFRATD